MIAFTTALLKPKSAQTFENTNLHQICFTHKNFNYLLTDFKRHDLNDPCINGMQYEDARNQTPGTVLTTSENAALSALCKLYFALNLLLQMLSSHVYVLLLSLASSPHTLLSRFSTSISGPKFPTDLN